MFCLKYSQNLANFKENSRLRNLYKPDRRPAQQEEEAGLAQGKHVRQHRTAAAAA